MLGFGVGFVDVFGPTWHMGFGQWMPVAWGIVALVALVAALVVPVLSARSGGASEMRWCRKYHAGVPSANDEWNAEMSGAF